MATVLTGAFLAYSSGAFDDSRTDLTAARSGAFDGVHVLERARARSAEIRALDNLLLLDRAHAQEYQDALGASLPRILRLPDGRVIDAKALSQMRAQTNRSSDSFFTAIPGVANEDLGGYLAIAFRADSSPRVRGPTVEAIAGFLTWLPAQNAFIAGAGGSNAQSLLEESERDVQIFETALGKALTEYQNRFDADISDTDDRLSGFSVGFGRLSLLVALLTGLLVVFGLSRRWSEYG